jgi:hypothetical protein
MKSICNRNLSKQKQGPDLCTTSTTWNNGIFEVAHASGVGRHVRAIGDDVDKRNGARRLRQGRIGEESRVRRRTRVGGKDEKDEKEGADGVFQIVGSGTFHAWTERSPYTAPGFFRGEALESALVGVTL